VNEELCSELAQRIADRLFHEGFLRSGEENPDEIDFDEDEENQVVSDAKNVILDVIISFTDPADDEKI
jgi:ribose 5-phosphate isomerase